MTWWFVDAARFQLERSALSELNTRADWLKLYEPRILPGFRLEWDFDITLRSEVFPMVLQYPSLFPDTPPTIKPRDGRRISAHQYGAGGELCLEYRADNWSTAVTGAMMIESAHRLILGEYGSDGADAIPSAHQASIGRALRGAYCRLLQTAWLQSFLSSLSEGQIVTATVIEREESGCFTAWIKSAVNEIEWTDDHVPIDGRKHDAKLARVSSLSTLGSFVSLEELEQFLTANGMSELAKEVRHPTEALMLLLTDCSKTRMFAAFTNLAAERVMIPYRTIVLPGERSRLGSDYERLEKIRVGIVGCGSLGSKVASMLARAGVGAFVLVDDDVLLPANLCRHDLDWRSVGNHKSAAVLARLKEINPMIDGLFLRVGLGAQEDAESTSAAMDSLGKCQLLIDATAMDNSFNFIAAVARRHSLPMVWGKVFAGGIGGLVARARPNADPSPLTARHQIQAWCEAQDTPWPNGGINYDATSEDGAPMIADDAEVTAIAAHVARLATDTILFPEQSHFRNSAYMVGMSKGWIFTDAFDTWPIDYIPNNDWKDHSEQPEDAVQEVIQFVEQFLKTVDDKNGTAAPD